MCMRRCVCIVEVVEGFALEESCYERSAIEPPKEEVDRRNSQPPRCLPTPIPTAGLLPLVKSHSDDKLYVLPDGLITNNGL